MGDVGEFLNFAVKEITNDSTSEVCDC